MNEIWITSPFLTPSKVKLPSISVIVPLDVPFTTTDAPVTGPKSSSTVPVTFPFCWEIEVPCSTGAMLAYMLPEKHNAPAHRIKLTGLKFFNITDGFINK